MLDGDPAQMRELAATLRGEADRLGALSDGVAGASASMDFQAPAADRIRSDLGDSSTALAGHAAELQDLAAALEGSATEIEQEQRAELAREEQQAELARLAQLAQTGAGAGS